jgi:flagella basal body P-ring formation protein FlgA
MAKVRIVCPAGTRISRVTSTVPNSAVEDAAIAAFRASRPDLPADAEIVVEPSSLNLCVAPGKVDVVAGAPRGNGETAPASVPISLVVDGKPVRSVEVMLRVRRTISAVVATRLVPAQTVLTAADVTIGRVDAAAAGPAPILDPAEVIGKRTARQLQAGRPIPADAVVSPPVILSGQAVEIDSVAGGAHAYAPGIARSSAAPGATVRVFCLKTQKELVGIAVDAKTVRIEGTP